MPSNTPSISSAGSAGTSSSRGSKRKVLNQVCSSFEESKSFEFDGRLDVLVVAEVF